MRSTAGNCAWVRTPQLALLTAGLSGAQPVRHPGSCFARCRLRRFGTLLAATKLFCPKLPAPALESPTNIIKRPAQRTPDTTQQNGSQHRQPNHLSAAKGPMREQHAACQAARAAAQNRCKVPPGKQDFHASARTFLEPPRCKAALGRVTAQEPARMTCRHKPRARDKRGRTANNCWLARTSPPPCATQKRPWQDSNLQSLLPKTNTLSIRRPQGLRKRPERLHRNALNC